MSSALVGLQTFGVLTQFSLMLLGNDTLASTTQDLQKMDDALGWTSFRMPMPWEGDAEDEAKAGVAAVDARLREVAGTSVPRHVILLLWQSERDFERTMFWAGSILVLLVVVHYPAKLAASRKVFEQKRLRWRKQALRVKVGAKPLADEGPSVLEQFVFTWPRLELYLLFFSVQSIAQRCAFAVASPATSTAYKVGAVILFLVWPVGFTLWVSRTLQTKLIHEKRATLVRKDKRTGGFLRWIDNTAPTLHAAKRKGSTGYTGFVDAYGPLFEDMTPETAGHTWTVFLVQRMLVGVAAGTLIMPSAAAGQRHIVVLALLFFALAMFLAVQRPFLVKIANLFEVLLLNLWFTSETVLGITMTKAQANGHMNTLLLVAFVFMAFRLVAVYLPTCGWFRNSSTRRWSSSPRSSASNGAPKRGSSRCACPEPTAGGGCRFRRRGQARALL